MAGGCFCPDVDVDQFDDEVAHVLHRIVQAVNRLHDELAEPSGLEAASLALHVGETVGQLDAGFTSLLSQVERALLEVHAAVTAGGPVPAASYEFSLNPDVYDDDAVRFFDEVAARSMTCAHGGRACPSAFEIGRKLPQRRIVVAEPRADGKG